jgi:glycosyltransferase involved in cell wall biosynthesis
MASGTPVIGFKTGGIPDMVRPDETGWLAEVGNVRALRDQIEHALRDKEKRERLGRNCREIVEEEYTLERQATQYQRLYEDLLHRQERSNGR